jgi:hypothetical protein
LRTVAVTTRKQRTFGKNWQIKRCARHQFLIVDIAAMYP